MDVSAFSQSVGPALQPLHLRNADAMVEVQGSISGPLHAPQVDARGLLHTARWDNMQASEVEFELQADLAAQSDVTVELRARDFQYRNHNADRAKATLQWIGNTLRIRRAEVARADTMVAMAAVYHQAKRDWRGDARASHRLQLETALMQVGLREIRLEEPATLWWTDKAAHLDSLRLVSRGGRLRVDGGFDLKTARIDGRAEVEDFDLEFLSSFAPWDHIAEGHGTGWFEAHGDLDRTQVDARLHIVDGSWNSMPFDSLQLELQSDAFSVELRRLQLGTPFGELSAAGRVGYLPAMRRWVQAQSGSRDAVALASASIEGSIELADMQLDRAWMARGAGVAEPAWQARVTAGIVLQGSVEAPRWSLRGSAQDVVLPEVHVDSLRVAAAFANDRLSVGEFAMQVRDARVLATGVLPVRGSLLGRPGWLRDEPVEAHIELPRSSFAVVQRLLTVFEPVPQSVPLGDIEGKLDIRGTLRDPVLEGAMQAHGVGFTFAGMEEVYENVNALGTFQGNTLALRDITGSIGKEGRVTGTGELRFGGLSVDDYHFDLQAHGILVNSVPQVLALVSGTIAVDGRTLRGDAVVPEFTGVL
jgi:autotransporter translocation and assembly factor TamB